MADQTWLQLYTDWIHNDSEPNFGNNTTQLNHLLYQLQKNDILTQEEVNTINNEVTKIVKYLVRKILHYHSILFIQYVTKN